MVQIANAEIPMTDDCRRAYEAWMSHQIASAAGERRRRLDSDSNYAEKLFVVKVWWPAFGHFDRLHAEYEVRDFKDGWRYLDFAYRTESFKICIEIDGFGAHWRDVDRTRFSDHLRRQNHLVIDGWYVLRFSFDDIKERPRMCQQIIQQLMGKLGSQSQPRNQPALPPTAQAIMNLAHSYDGPITPKLAAARLGIHRTTAIRHIRSLVKKELLVPARKDVKRICHYRINIK